MVRCFSWFRPLLRVGRGISLARAIQHDLQQESHQIAERGGRGLEEGDRRPGCPIGQTGRDLGPPREGCSVEWAGGGAGLEESDCRVGRAGRKAGQTETDAGPFLETLFAEPLFQRLFPQGPTS